jgi:hypothetical protein
MFFHSRTGSPSFQRIISQFRIPARPAKTKNGSKFLKSFVTSCPLAGGSLPAITRKIRVYITGVKCSTLTPQLSAGFTRAMGSTSISPRWKAHRHSFFNVLKWDRRLVPGGIVSRYWNRSAAVQSLAGMAPNAVANLFKRRSEIR